MNALHLNDRSGAYPESWYVASATPLTEQPILQGSHRFDVCVVGAGITGLSAAWHLARKGMSVAVLEAHRIGFGASGRNGGQVGSGYNLSQASLSRSLGADTAGHLWALAQEAKADILDFNALHADIGYKPGVVYACGSRQDVSSEHSNVRYLQQAYDYRDIEPLDQKQLRALVKTDAYLGGSVDWGAGHLHPLRYTLELARAALRAGAAIFERSEVLCVQEGARVSLKCAQGEVQAEHVVFAGNGYLSRLNTQVANHVMPINSFIGATEPLDPKVCDVLTRDIAVADSSFVVNYYRMTEDNRFLFGGLENYTLKFPQNPQVALHERMISLFPQLTSTPFDYIWGGTLGITMKRLPFIQRLAPNMVTASGFSGHGVALSGLSGKVMAEAIAGQAGRFETLSLLPSTSFPGGHRLRSPLLALAMSWYALRDRIGL